ncbi:hypothetical protein NQT69_13690 [Pseudoalteromonas shioyasakiensis]|uniref:hypothetical protein n=1 Tax=Pseudoalteromonas shioyasakiensis TaxID=1190813 RepID=UPI002119B226|nr:hypothetical protein [Pseudoalteromonas shioyasakiensis]MCQ8879057.1 hypothetical protein [Pseudoalteromonas shioyasakiensis]
MCGSVKSNRAANKSQCKFDNDLSVEQRLRFSAKANLAQARLAERERCATSLAAQHKAQQAEKRTFFKWLKRLVLK